MENCDNKLTHLCDASLWKAWVPLRSSLTLFGRAGVDRGTCTAPSSASADAAYHQLFQAVVMYEHRRREKKRVLPKCMDWSCRTWQGEETHSITRVLEIAVHSKSFGVGYWREQVKKRRSDREGYAWEHDVWGNAFTYRWIQCVIS